MPFGRGWFGWGGGRGWGRGNPYPFCRNFPWLPRWWWTGMYGPITPFTGAPRMPYGQYSTSALTAAPWTTYTPYYAPPHSMYTPPTTAMPSMMYPSPYVPSPYPTGTEIPQNPKEQERQMLEGQAAALQQQLNQIKKRLEELSKM